MLVLGVDSADRGESRDHPNREPRRGDSHASPWRRARSARAWGLRWWFLTASLMGRNQVRLQGDRKVRRSRACESPQARSGCSPSLRPVSCSHPSGYRDGRGGGRVDGVHVSLVVRGGCVHVALAVRVDDMNATTTNDAPHRHGTRREGLASLASGAPCARALIGLTPVG